MANATRWEFSRRRVGADVLMATSGKRTLKGEARVEKTLVLPLNQSANSSIVGQENFRVKPGRSYPFRAPLRLWAFPSARHVRYSLGDAGSRYRRVLSPKLESLDSPHSTEDW